MCFKKKCAKCKELKNTNEFYKQKTHKYGVMSYCKNCFNRNVQNRWVERKKQAINDMGGCCKDCGLKLKDSHYSVFEFHHINPSEKDSDWSKLRLKSKTAIQKELSKCVLLCANCHRIRHAKNI